MRRRLDIPPRYIVATIAVLALLMVGTAYVELHQSREELYGLMREEALSLAETIALSGANAITSMEHVEALLAERLLNNGYHIAQLDSAGTLRPQDLARISQNNRIFRINVFDRKGTKIMSSHSSSDEHTGMPQKHSPLDFLAPLLAGRVNQLVIGVKEARVEEGQRFAVALRRTHSSGGAIVLNIDAQELLALRRSTGIGRLIRDLGDNSGITYVALQDTAGILAASGRVQELTSLAADSLLRYSIASDTALTRIIAFNDLKVFEVFRPFTHEGTSIGVLRIGLTMDEVQNAEARMTRRMVIISLVVFVIGALAVAYLMAQQNTRMMEKKYSSIRTYTGNILATMGEGVISVDHRGFITIFNARAGEITGLNPATVEGQRLEDAAREHGVKIEDIFAQEDGNSEAMLTLSDRTHRIVAVTLSKTVDPDGRGEGRTAVLRDVTEARRMERESQRTEKLAAMGELASGVAHEVRNPLNAMAMIAQRFSREFTPRQGVKEYRSLTKVLQEEALRVNKIIQQFLSFARPPKLHRAPIAIGDLIDHVASLFAAQAKEKGIVFTASVSGNAVVSLDREQMTQALLNLLQNALEATPAHGRITLTAHVGNDELRIVVADTGRGISPGSLDKIFNLYYTTKPEGTGLGLSITQQIVSQHGGLIEVTSTEGQGTVFTIEFPSTVEFG